MDLPELDVPDGCVLIGTPTPSYPPEWFLVATANRLFTVIPQDGAIIERLSDTERSPEEWLTSAVLAFPEERRFGYLCLRTGDLYVWL